MGLLESVFLEQSLAVLAEDLVARVALKGHVRELVAHDTKHLFDQLSL